MNRGIAHEESVISKSPKISDDGYGSFRKCRYRILVGQSFCSVLRGKYAPQFFVFESDKIYVEVFLLQGRKLKTQKIVVPTRVERELVVREDVGALLCFAEVIENDYRHFWEHSEPSVADTPPASP